MLQVIPMSTHDFIQPSNGNHHSNGNLSVGHTATPQKATSMITNQAIVKSALAKSNSSSNTKPPRNNPKHLPSDSTAGLKKSSRRSKQRSSAGPDVHNSTDNLTKPSAAAKKASNKPKSSDGDVFSTNTTLYPTKLSQSLDSPSSVSLSSVGGGFASASEVPLTHQQQSFGAQPIRSNKAKVVPGMASPVKQQEISTSNVQTPKPSRKKKARDETRTPDRRYEGSDFADDSAKDLKEILFPDLYGAKPTPVRPKLSNSNTGPQTPGNKPRNSNNKNFNGNLNGNQMYSTQPVGSSPSGDCFAGSSFHNSPAPSALPKPSFKPKTACALYSQSENFPPVPATSFERMISNKFSNNDSPATAQPDNYSLENDLKRLLNVHQG